MQPHPPTPTVRTLFLLFIYSVIYSNFPSLPINFPISVFCSLTHTHTKKKKTISEKRIWFKGSSSYKQVALPKVTRVNHFPVMNLYTLSFFLFIRFVMILWNFYALNFLMSIYAILILLPILLFLKFFNCYSIHVVRREMFISFFHLSTNPYDMKSTREFYIIKENATYRNY